MLFGANLQYLSRAFRIALRHVDMSNQFKLPIFRNRNVSTIQGVPTFDIRHVKVKDRIGNGSFGEVFTADFSLSERAAETVVVKKAIGALDGEEKKLFLKEVALLNKLNHPNVVSLKAVCYTPCAFMMEYVYFSFTPFGDDIRVSSLGDLLLHIDAACRCEGFEKLVAFAVKEIVSGLGYLHFNGVAHRDLKPANILVSNQHYCFFNETEITRQFSLRPVVCKLTDFGESRSKYLQTNTVLASKTGRVDRGTTVFMSPEILVQGESKFNASLPELMLSDMWSLGMTVFTMINPSLKCPFLLEIRSSSEQIHSPEAVTKFVSNLLRDNRRPLTDAKYNKHRAREWSSLEEVYLGCTNWDPTKRLSILAVEKILSGEYSVSKNCDQFKLNVTQSTATELNDRRVAFKLQCSDENQFESSEQASVVSNDGTNACAFLSVKIAEKIIHGLDGNSPNITTLVPCIEEVIWYLPGHINTKRDMTRFYDVMEAYTMLSNEQLLDSGYDLYEELPFDDCVYSFDGRRKLHEKLCCLGQTDFTAVFSSEPYVVVIGCAGSRAFLVDTHTGSLLVGRNNANNTWKSLCLWLWDRIVTAGVKEGSGQSLSTLTPRKR